MAKIIIVDDEQGILNLCKRILLTENYEVETFSEGYPAIEEIKKRKDEFDIVVTDLKMPKMDGIELLKSIKKISDRIDVIIMTGYATISSVVEAIKEGAYDYIAKPFEIDEFKLKIKNCFEKRKLKNEIDELKDIIALNTICQALNSTVGLKELLKMIINMACKSLEADRGSIMLLDETTGELKLEATCGFEVENPKEIKIKIGEGVSGWVAKEQKPLLLIDGLKNYPQFSNLKGIPAIKSAIISPIMFKNDMLNISTPIKTKNTLIGVINLSRTKNEKYFTEKEVKLLSIYATGIRLAIEDARIYEKMKEVERMKNEFISNVSHELKTPLTAIENSNELLLESSQSNFTNADRNLLEINQRNIERMKELINELLDFSRIETGSLKIIKEENSIKQIIEETINEMKLFAEKKKIKIEKSLSAEVPPFFFDGTRIKQVMINLIDNAIKFTPEYGVINIELKTDGDLNTSGSIIVSVADTGIGIPQKYHKMIFEKFFQVDSSTTRSTGGMGLGLAIAKNIIEKHGGSIWVESEPEKGSKFTFELPYISKK